MAPVTSEATGPMRSPVLKVVQRLGGKQDSSDPEIMRHNLPVHFEYSTVSTLLNEAYGPGWLPEFVGRDGVPCPLTEESFSRFLELGVTSSAAKQVYHIILHHEEAPGETSGVSSYWQVCLNAGWVSYDEPYLSKIQATHAAGERFVMLEYSNHWRYEVDLERLEQRNLKTDYIRKVRLRLPLEGKAAADAAVAARDNIYLLTPLWLHALTDGASRAAVVECRSSGTALRARPDGRVDCWGCTGPRATFIMEAAPGSLGDGKVVVAFRNVNGGYLRPSAATPNTLVCADDKVEEDCFFEVRLRPSRETSAASKLAAAGCSTFGAALCLSTTGQYVGISEAGEAVLVDEVPEGKEQPAEMFVFRYQPNYDEAWKTDDQYSGRRTWLHGNDCNYYTFTEFLAFVQKESFTMQPFGESGLVAAKVLWASSVEEDTCRAEMLATVKLSQALGRKKRFSDYGPNPKLYTFSQMLAFVEARNLRAYGKTDIETVCHRWCPAWPTPPQISEQVMVPGTHIAETAVATST